MKETTRTDCICVLRHWPFAVSWQLTILRVAHRFVCVRALDWMAPIFGQPVKKRLACLWLDTRVCCTRPFLSFVGNHYLRRLMAWWIINADLLSDPITLTIVCRSQPSNGRSHFQLVGPKLRRHFSRFQRVRRRYRRENCESFTSNRLFHYLPPLIFYEKVIILKKVNLIVSVAVEKNRHDEIEKLQQIRIYQ